MKRVSTFFLLLLGISPFPQRPPAGGRSANTEDDLRYANGEFLTYW